MTTALIDDLRVVPEPTGDGLDAMFSWSRQARCRGATHLFFAPDRERPGRRGRREAAARALCANCPVLAPCRAWARENHEFGFWGGETEEERAAAGYRPALACGFVARLRAS
jgi:WhiB family transcriptional regulator, redox-sensing transcriptional regulator